MMKVQKIIRWSVTLLLMVSAMPLACYGASLAEQAYIKWTELEKIYFLDSTWHLLPLPPEKAKGFAGITAGTVYVQTVNGKLLGCFQPSEVDSKCWFEIENIPTVPQHISDYALDCPVDRLQPIPESPPKLHEIESIQVRYCAISFREWTVSDFKYVLTENGEIWQYGYDGLDLVETPLFTRRQWNLTRVKITLLGFSVGGLLPLFALILICSKRTG